MHIIVCFQYDGLVADFPDYQPSGVGSGSGYGHDGGSGRRTGYSSYSDYKWKVLNENNMNLLRSQKGRPVAQKTADVRGEKIVTFNIYYSLCTIST